MRVWHFKGRDTRTRLSVVVISPEVNEYMMRDEYEHTNILYILHT